MIITVCAEGVILFIFEMMFWNYKNVMRGYFRVYERIKILIGIHGTQLIIHTIIFITRFVVTYSLKIDL